MNFSFNKTVNVYISKEEFGKFLYQTYLNNKGVITPDGLYKVIKQEAKYQIDCPIDSIYVDAPGLFKPIEVFSDFEIKEILEKYEKKHNLKHFYNIDCSNYKKRSKK